MTVINKLNQTLEMLKSCESNCKTFAMDTDDPNAKQLFTQIAQNLKQSTDMFESRVNYVMGQEPQYLPKDQRQQFQQNQEMQSIENAQNNLNQS